MTYKNLRVAFTASTLGAALLLVSQYHSPTATAALLNLKPITPIRELIAKTLFRETPEGLVLLENVAKQTHLLPESFTHAIEAHEGWYANTQRLLVQSRAPETSKAIDQAVDEVEEILGLARRSSLNENEALAISHYAKARFNTKNPLTGLAEHFAEKQKLLAIRGTSQSEPLPAEIADGVTHGSLAELINGEAPIQATTSRVGPIEEAKAVGKVRKLLRDMKICLASQTESQVAASAAKDLWTSLGISEALTLSGYVLNSTSKAVHWKDLPMDLVMTALSSVAGSKLLSANPTLLVRSVQTVAFGQGRAAVDATVYFLSPLTDTHGEPLDDATIKRWTYNSKWSVATAPVSVAIGFLTSGMSCLSSSPSVSVAKHTIRIGSQVGMNFAYFQVKSFTMGK